MTSVRIEGKNLAGAHLYFSGGGISVKSLTVAGDLLTAELNVESGARLGPHEVRIATLKGVSNGARFWVDLYPNQVLEKPMAEGAPPVALEAATPMVVNGRIAVKAGRDRFVLTAAAGETWVFDCFADRIRSRFDPVLELRDENGVSLRLVESTWESDPRFCYRFAKAGRYSLTVRDSEYNGGSNYTYRLLVGRMPFVSGFSPRGGRPGQSVQLAVQGTNLPMSSTTVSIPADAAPGTYWAEMPMGAGSTTLLPMMVGPEPVLAAGDAETGRALSTLPVAVDGVFLHAPTARFSFHATPKTRILFDLLGRRIGSRIDGEIRVLNAEGKEVAENDDAPSLGKDARLEFAPPAEGEYTVEVRNVEEITGPDCYYRLMASPVEPDYRLSIATDRLNAPQGGTVTLPINLERLGGFNGPVEVRVEGLPAGVTTTGGVIGAGKSSVEITLTAAPNAAFSAADVHILGSAVVGGKTVQREAPGWERYEHRSIDLLLSVEYSYTRPFHLWDLLLLAVTERNAPITLSTSGTSLDLAQGGKVEIPVHVVRDPSAKDEIKLEVRGLPAKVTASAPPIPANQTEGKIVLTAAPDAAPDLTNIIIQGTHAKSTALAPAIRLSLRKN